MSLRYGVALVEGDTVTAEACFPDEGASAITTLAQLRARQDVCWITNFSADELRDRRLVGNVANDAFLGVRIASIMAELGLSTATPTSAREAVLHLATIVVRTLSMAEQAFGMSDESSVVEAATSTGVTGLIAADNDESAALLMVSASAALRPPAPTRPGAVVLPMRRQRFAHARDTLACNIPEGPLDMRVTDLDLDAVLEDDEMPVMVELGQPMEGLFALGPYGHRPVIAIKEYVAYLAHRPNITPRVTQAWTAAEGWADHAGELAPIPIILSGKHEGHVWECGPLRVRGPDVMSYSLGLIAEAVWRGITSTRSSAAAWMLANERFKTLRYAMAVDAAARAEGVSEVFRIVSFRHGVVWVETTLPPTEERWSTLAQIAERTGLLPPPLPACAPTDARYIRACKLLSPKTMSVEKHWLGAMLALGDTSRKRLL